MPIESKAISSTPIEWSLVLEGDGVDKSESPIRQVLGDSLGMRITPELAAQVEIAHIKTLHRRIERFEQAVVESGAPQVYCRVRHHFASGVYGREISIPAGTAVTGAVHKVDNIVVLSRGLIEVATPGGILTMRPGDTVICTSGTKNAVTAIEDAQWTNFYQNPMNLNDPSELVESLYYAKASELLGGSENKQLKAYAQEVLL